ncbi:MAG: glycosyltransferase family 4 protein [Cetobacterium sp.]
MEKKKVLFLLPRYSENTNDSTLEKELVLEFLKRGHEVTVASLLERSEKKKTYTKKVDNVNVLKINSGNYYSKGTTKYEKGLTLLSIPFVFFRGIKNNIKEKIDLIILSTPMMNNSNLIKKLKEKYGCKVILIVWDIFPQNAIDLEIIKNPLMIKYLKKKYIKALIESNFITTMSQGNKDYLEKNYGLNSNKVFVLKNWSNIKPSLEIKKRFMKEKYGYKENDFICIFGGNMGKPQNLDNILKLAEKVKENSEIKFLFIGSGTEKDRLEKCSKNNRLKNINFFNQISREDYEMLTASCDVGLVSLDERFTVPNFPSKTTDYFKLKLPILASLDGCSAKDYGIFLQEEAKAGLYAQAGNIEELHKQFLKLYEDKNLRNTLGNNGRKYYEKNLGVDRAYKTIMDEIEKK